MANESDWVDVPAQDSDWVDVGGEDAAEAAFRSATDAPVYSAPSVAPEMEAQNRLDLQAMIAKKKEGQLPQGELMSPGKQFLSMVAPVLPAIPGMGLPLSIAQQTIAPLTAEEKRLPFENFARTASDAFTFGAEEAAWKHFGGSPLKDPNSPAFRAPYTSVPADIVGTGAQIVSTYGFGPSVTTIKELAAYSKPLAAAVTSLMGGVGAGIQGYLSGAGEALKEDAPTLQSVQERAALQGKFSGMIGVALPLIGSVVANRLGKYFQPRDLVKGYETTIMRKVANVDSKMDSKIATALPEMVRVAGGRSIQELADETGKIPMRVGVDLVKSATDEIGPKMNVIRLQQGTVPPVDLTPIADKMVSNLTSLPHYKTIDPRITKIITDSADLLRGKTLTLDGLEAKASEIGQTLYGGKNPRTGIDLHDYERKALETARSMLSEEVDRIRGEIAGPEGAKLNEIYSSLKSLQSSLDKQASKIEKKFPGLSPGVIQQLVSGTMDAAAIFNLFKSEPSTAALIAAGNLTLKKVRDAVKDSKDVNKQFIKLFDRMQKKMVVVSPNTLPAKAVAQPPPSAISATIGKNITEEELEPEPVQ